MFIWSKAVNYARKVFMELSPAYFTAASVTKKKIGFIKSEPDRGEQPSALRLGVSVIKLFLRLFHTRKF